MGSTTAAAQQDPSTNKRPKLSESSDTQGKPITCKGWVAYAAKQPLKPPRDSLLVVGVLEHLVRCQLHATRRVGWCHTPTRPLHHA